MHMLDEIHYSHVLTVVKGEASILLVVTLKYGFIGIE